ncbi:MAG: helix-turn-helix domain-containing protein [Candidatus Dormibacteria bacterium]
MPIHPSIPVLLRSARVGAGLSQQTVAARMGTTQSAVARAESAAGTVPTLAFLERYSTAVGRSLAPVIKPTGATAPSLEEMRRLGPRLTKLARRLGFLRVQVVGSVARGEARPDSDVDLVVQPGKSLHGAAYFGAMDRMREGAERIIGRNVDVLDAAAVRNQRTRERLQRDAKSL